MSGIYGGCERLLCGELLGVFVDDALGLAPGFVCVLASLSCPGHVLVGDELPKPVGSGEFEVLERHSELELKKYSFFIFPVFYLFGRGSRSSYLIIPVGLAEISDEFVCDVEPSSCHESHLLMLLEVCDVFGRNVAVRRELVGQKRQHPVGSGKDEVLDTWQVRFPLGGVLVCDFDGVLTNELAEKNINRY